MANNNKASSPNQISTLTTTDISSSQYKKTIIEISTKMFNIHTSMIAAI